MVSVFAAVVVLALIAFTAAYGYSENNKHKIDDEQD